MNLGYKELTVLTHIEIPDLVTLTEAFEWMALI
jgi:hypothetical protein